MAALVTTSALARSTRLGSGDGAREVDFTLHRSARRSMQLSIDHRGLRLAIPARMSEAEALRFMHSKADWVLAKLVEWEARQTAAIPPALTEGLRFPILGQPCELRFDASLRQPRWEEGFYNRVLWLPRSDGVKAQKHLMRALQSYALAYFAGRIDEYAYRLQAFAPTVARPALHLSNARTRWGSCSRISGVRLNWRLIHLAPSEVDYVVAHELAHLLEMNHSARFWAVVARLFPDYKTSVAAMHEANRIIPAWA